MAPKLPSIRDQVARSVDLYRKVFALLRFSSGRLGLIVAGLTLVEIALFVAALFLTKYVVEQAATSDAFRENVGTLFGFVTLILGMFLAGRVVQAVANYYRAAQGFIVTDYVNQAIQERAVAADLSFYDSSLYFDNLELARQAGAQRPAQVVANALNVLRSGLILLAITFVILTIEWLLLPISLVAVALVMVVQLTFTKARFRLQRQLVQTERGAAYADFLMTTAAFAKEIRLWNLGAYLQTLYRDLRKDVRKDYLAIERRKSRAEVFVACVGAVLFVTAAGYVLWRFSLGQASVSDLVMLILLLIRAETAGRDFVSSLSRLYDDQLYLTQIFSFLDLAPVIQSKGSHKPLPADHGGGVVLESVSFRYPGSDTPALRDVSLELKPGQFTALVGGNGSGKTTLIKLLCRLYDPEAGRITYRGQDIRNLDPFEYRREFSVIFQDFIQFAFTGRDNVRLAELGLASDEDRLKQVARLTGADEVLTDLPQGYDTILSRMFDGGVELSGGQWQKIALARAMFPTSSFVILDEPTSAIDPNAEADLFEGFRDKLGGRGALVISHRLSTIRMADYTYVLDKGRIVEEGTHEALIAMKGTYAEMFERQGRRYRS